MYSKRGGGGLNLKWHIHKTLDLETVVSLATQNHVLALAFVG
jgi:hypothetical protein